MLVLSPIVLALSTYMAVVYGYLYLLFTTITEVYEDNYHFSQGSVGLTFLGIGIGSLFGVITFGFISDRIVKAKAKDGEMKAEYRLPPMIPGSFLVPIGRKSLSLPTDPPPTHPLTYLPPLTSLPLRLDSRQTHLLDRPHHRHRDRRPRPPRNLYAHPNLPRRRLHHLRRLRSRRKHGPQIPSRRAPPSRGEKNVSDFGTGVGKFAAGVHCVGDGADPVGFL